MKRGEIDSLAFLEWSNLADMDVMHRTDDFKIAESALSRL
jgi:hypothetical protein